MRKAGRIQYLVNNAGYTVTGALEETSIEEARPAGKGVALSRLRRFVPASMFDRSLRTQLYLG